MNLWLITLVHNLIGLILEYLKEALDKFKLEMN